MSQVTTPSTKSFDTLYFICRSQPFTLGHKHNIDTAKMLADHVVVIKGSAFRARDTRNPFTFEERADMIRSVYPNDPDLTILPLRDYPYNDNTWASYVQKIVEETRCPDRDRQRIGIIGHMKEDTYYLNLFPQWDFVPVESLGDNRDMNATNVRKAYFEDGTIFSGGISANVTQMLAPAVRTALFDFKFDDDNKITEHYLELRNEYFHVKKYRAAWDAAPYAPTFITCDCLIVQSGHVLLIKRKSAPGKGLWAIPGGFLNQGERIIDGIFRELMEETVIKVPMKVLRGSLVGQHVYDHPQRSLRGRVITHAGIVHLQDGPLPKVKGSDDAAKAKWFPINEVYNMQDKFFEDHFFIVEDLLNRFPTRN